MTTIQSIKLPNGKPVPRERVLLATAALRELAAVSQSALREAMWIAEDPAIRCASRYRDVLADFGLITTHGMTAPVAAVVRAGVLDDGRLLVIAGWLSAKLQ